MKDKNQPAFPVIIPAENGNTAKLIEGMTLRDYFAAAVLPVLCNHYKTYDNAAAAAYKLANSMMKEREQL
jgi:hypothetical protein